MTTIPQPPLEKPTYICDAPGCDYRDTDKLRAEAHHGIQHAAKERREINGVDILRFDSEEDAKLFRRYGDRAYKIKWEGPGWYAIEESTYERGDPDPCFNLHPAKELASEWRAESERMLMGADELDTLLG